MKKYTLSILYDEDIDEIEYISEDIEEDVRTFMVGDIDITGYWDKDTLELISKMYDIGVA